VLQGVAGCGDFDRRRAVAAGVLQCVAGCCRVLRGVAGCCRVLEGVGGCWRVLEGVGGCRSVS